MATYNWGLDLSFTASVDMNDYQYHFVKAGSVAGEITLANAVGGSLLGVLQNDPRAGEEATVRVLGTTKVAAGSANVAWGAPVMSSSTGHADTFAVATACANAVGIALESVTANSYAEIFLLGGINRLADA